MAVKRPREDPASASLKRAKVVQTKLQLMPLVPKPLPSGRFGAKEVHIACWNVNGLRACMQKDVFLKFLERENLDVLAFNETKLQDSHTPAVKSALRSFFPYQYYCCSEAKKGYSGVAILSNTEAKKVTSGIGLQEFDLEGRVLTAEFDFFSLVVVYTPNSGSELSRLEARVNTWDAAFSCYLKRLMDSGKSIICVGDLNVVHRDIDICAADREMTEIPGSTAEEKQSFTRLLDTTGLVDTYRQLHPDTVQYSWFANDSAWRINRGRRLDYALASCDLIGRVKSSEIHEKVRASDHCPIEVTLENTDAGESNSAL